MHQTPPPEDWEARRRILRHELRTPVNHILGFAQLLREDADDAGRDEIVSHLHAIEGAGKQALVIIINLTGALGLDDTAVAAHAAKLSDLMHGIDERIALMRAWSKAHSATEMNDDINKVELGAQRLMAMVEQVKAHGRIESEVEAQPAQAGPASKPEPIPVRAASQSRPEAVVHLGPTGETGRILVVEDNRLSREALVRMLEKMGHSLQWAENGREALDLLAEQPIDLVLLDIMMPVMDGYHVLEQRRGSAKLRDIPFVMISAFGEMSSVVRCIEMGAEDYLSKPFDPVLLSARISACLEKKRLREEVQSLKLQVEQAKSYTAK